MTTNGYLLERDAAALVEAGIDRFNVSIDSLQRDRFFEMTRRDALPQVLPGSRRSPRSPRRTRSRSTPSRCAASPRTRSCPSPRFAREHPYEVRFIEFMPLDADRAWTRDQVLTGEEIRAAIHAVHPLEPEPREPHATARVYRFADGQGRIGFINPVSEPFCGDCNRIRLTADGRLRTCLFSLNETDLRAPLRAGASDDELEQIIRDAVWRKELKHHVNEPGFIQPPRTMSRHRRLRRSTPTGAGSHSASASTTCTAPHSQAATSSSARSSTTTSTSSPQTRSEQMRVAMNMR